MPQRNHQPTRRNVRLDTLVRLRWLAVIGQTSAVLVVYFGLDFTLPIWACLAVIALVGLAQCRAAHALPARRSGSSPTARPGCSPSTSRELAVLLFLTGGLQNPFAFLLLGPVLLSATALPPRMTLMLGAVRGAVRDACSRSTTIRCRGTPTTPLQLPLRSTSLGVWLAILLAIGFIGVYAWQVAEEARQLADALAATELVLAREQHLSQLDGLAAAAAHELGTPLATITVVAKELERALDAELAACRRHRACCASRRSAAATSSAKLTELSASGEPFDRMPLSALIEEVVAPHRNFGVAIDVALPADEPPSRSARAIPAILYGLGNLSGERRRFRREAGRGRGRMDDDEVAVTISDDGPGFAPEIMDRIGEPYVTSRRQRRMNVERRGDGGLGLGFFIAKTLLERSGATLDFRQPASSRDRGAVVRIRLGRGDFERSPQSPPTLRTVDAADRIGLDARAGARQMIPVACEPMASPPRQSPPNARC